MSCYGTPINSKRVSAHLGYSFLFFELLLGLDFELGLALEFRVWLSLRIVIFLFLHNVPVTAASA